MFGNNKEDNQIPDQSIEGALADSGVVPPTNHPTDASGDAQNWQHPGAPLDSSQLPAPVDPAVVPGATPTTITPTDSPAHDTVGPNNDLIDIKQQALNQLSPLIGHLDQAPEEKFRTTMMMIQASDDQSLVKAAYEAAQQITDEKARAQALLDIVNEINYFTQNQHATP